MGLNRPKLILSYQIGRQKVLSLLLAFRLKFMGCSWNFISLLVMLEVQIVFSHIPERIKVLWLL